MIYGEHMAFGKVRTTLVLDQVIVEKIRQNTKNMSEFVNQTLREKLFTKKSMFGALKGKGVTKELLKMREEDENAHPNR